MILVLLLGSFQNFPLNILDLSCLVSVRVLRQLGYAQRRNGARAELAIWKRIVENPGTRND